MRILLATNNHGSDLGMQPLETEEGSDIFENAERQARAYFGKIELPILGMDSAFVIPQEASLDSAKVRRNALEGQNEAAMRPEAIGQVMILQSISSKPLENMQQNNFRRKIGWVRDISPYSGFREHATFISYESILCSIAGASGCRMRLGCGNHRGRIHAP